MIRLTQTTLLELPASLAISAAADTDWQLNASGHRYLVAIQNPERHIFVKPGVDFAWDEISVITTTTDVDQALAMLGTAHSFIGVANDNGCRIYVLAYVVDIREKKPLELAAPALLAEIEREYTTLADVHNNWPGRHTMQGQTKLCRLRDLIAAATGRGDQEVQDDYGMRASRERDAMSATK